MNSVSVQVGGAIGVAALGSVLKSEYTSSISPVLADLPDLPLEVVTAAEDSVGGAMMIVNQLPLEAGEIVTSSAHSSFMDGWQIMVFVVSGVAIMDAIMIFKFVPPRLLQQSETDIPH